MVLVKFDDVEKQVYYNDSWYPTLVASKALVRNDRDLKAIYAGRSRVGKSVKAMQDAKFCDPTFNIKRIVYTARDFVALANKLPPRSAIVLDESRHSGGGDWAQGKEAKIFLDYLNEVGQKNLYIFLLLPDFWDLRTALATNLSHYLVHVYEEENVDFNPDELKSDPLTRGHFDLYNFEDKNFLYYKNKHYHRYAGVKPTLRNLDFSNTFVVDEEEYRKLKYGGLEKYENPSIWESGSEHKDKFERGEERGAYTLQGGWISIGGLGLNLRESEGWTLQEAADKMKIPEPTLRTNINRWLEKHKQVQAGSDSVTAPVENSLIINEGVIGGKLPIIGEALL